MTATEHHASLSLSSSKFFTQVIVNISLVISTNKHHQNIQGFIKAKSAKLDTGTFKKQQITVTKCVPRSQGHKAAITNSIRVLLFNNKKAKQLSTHCKLKTSNTFIQMNIIQKIDFNLYG